MATLTAMPPVALDLSRDHTEASRYHRQELITWWDQDRLSASRVLVVGAGALGNEIVKNLVLLGVGHIDVIDLDIIERSNLARCVFFREEDEGRPKAEVVCQSAAGLNPDVTLRAHPGSVMLLGLGQIAEFDLIIAGLDNREARLWVGQAARKLGLPWIDGAIEGLRGLVRVFLPEGACYECTLGEKDREILAHRRSCALLSTQEMESGKVPTNATTAGIVAAMQVQEAVKILVGQEDLLALRNQAFVYTGDVLDTYTVTYTEDEYCLSHDRYESLIPAPATERTTLRDLAALGTQHLGGAPDAIEFESELVLGRRCAQCGFADHPNQMLATLQRGDGECPRCESALALDARRTFAPDDGEMDLALLALGGPSGDVVTVRTGTDRVHLVVEHRVGNPVDDQAPHSNRPATDNRKDAT